LRSDLRHCTGDGVTHAFMVGLGETNFPLFALALGKTQATAGLVATIPQLIGALLQLCAPWGVEKIGSPRKWIMLCATIQCVSFAPMVVAALMGVMPTWLLFAVASVYWAVNLGAAPAWNTWIGALIPKRIRSHYFGWRSRVYQLAILVALLLGGLVLALGDRERAQRLFGADITPEMGVMASFAFVFVLAGLSRLWSVRFLRRKSEPPNMDVRSHRRIHWWEFIKRMRGSTDGRVLGAMVLMTVSVQVAQPFFVPYMNKQLGFSDSAVLAMIAAGFAAKSVSAPFWSAYARRHGARRLFGLGAMAIVPISLMWMVSGDFWYLLALQGLTGAAFGAFELGFFFLSLEAIREDERTSMLALFLVFNSFAAAAGSLVGKAMLEFVPAAMTAYLALFGLSAFLRMLAVVPIRRIRTDVLHPRPIATIPLALRPSAGSIDAPEPASLPQDRPGRAPAPVPAPAPAPAPAPPRQSGDDASQ
jgi:MFS family permease